MRTCFQFGTVLIALAAIASPGCGGREFEGDTGRTKVETPVIQPQSDAVPSASKKNYTADIIRLEARLRTVNRDLPGLKERLKKLEEEFDDDPLQNVDHVLLMAKCRRRIGDAESKRSKIESEIDDLRIRQSEK